VRPIDSSAGNVGPVSNYTMGALAFIAMILDCLAVLAGAGQPAQDVTLRRLNSNIPAAIHAKYKDIRDAKDWLNPKVTIRAEGVEVITEFLPGGRTTVAPAALRDLLISLPVKAWPYGRVILASDMGLRRADRSDDEPIRRNHNAAEEILKSLDVEVDWWPS